jgi:hypothetical protein
MTQIAPNLLEFSNNEKKNVFLCRNQINTFFFVFENSSRFEAMRVGHTLVDTLYVSCIKLPWLRSKIQCFPLQYVPIWFEHVSFIGKHAILSFALSFQKWLFEMLMFQISTRVLRTAKGELG